MTTTRRLAGASITAAAIFVAGCGSSASGTLSKADFQKQANAICKSYNAKIGALKAPSAMSDIPAYADKAVSLTNDALTQLRDLKPPKSLQGDFDKYLGYGEEVKKLAEGLKAAAVKNDQKALQRASDAGSRNGKASDQIATRLGLTECAKG